MCAEVKGGRFVDVCGGEGRQIRGCVRCWRYAKGESKLPSPQSMVMFILNVNIGDQCVALVCIFV